METPALLRIVAGIGFVLLAGGIAQRTARFPPRGRQYVYAVAAAVCVQGLTFLGDGLYLTVTGVETALSSAGYGIAWMIVALVICAVAGAGRRSTAIVVAVAGLRFALLIAGVYLVAFLGPAFMMVSMVGSLIGSLLAWIYLLQRPVARVARTRSSKRLLLFTKLKYLSIIAWIAHSASIGLFSAMIMVGLPADLTRIYLDVIVMIGIATVALRSGDALAETGAETSLLSFGSDTSANRVAAADGAD